MERLSTVRWHSPPPTSVDEELALYDDGTAWLTVRRSRDGEPVTGYADDVLARLREFALKRKSARLRKELQKMNPTTDERYDGLFQELIATDGELRRLRERGHVHA